jgi:hypothetical protein
MEREQIKGELIIILGGTKMLTEKIDFDPEKIMKIYRLIRIHELYTELQQYRPKSGEEIAYFISSCMEVKRRRK